MMEIEQLVEEIGSLSEGTLSPEHARDIAQWIVENTPEVEIHNTAGKPSMCKVWQGGVLLFSGFSPPF